MKITKEFRDPDFLAIKEKLKGMVIFDSRNFYELSELRAVGKEYFSIGGK